MVQENENPTNCENVGLSPREDPVEWLLDKALEHGYNPEEIRKARKAYHEKNPDAWWKVDYVYSGAFDNSAKTYARLTEEEHKCALEAIRELKNGKAN